MFTFHSSNLQATYQLEFSYEYDPGDRDTPSSVNLTGISEAFVDGRIPVSHAIRSYLFEELHGDGLELDRAIEHVFNQVSRDGNREAHSFARPQ